VQWAPHSRCPFLLPYYAYTATLLFLNQTLDNEKNTSSICKTILMQEGMVKDFFGDVAVMFCVVCGCSVRRNALFCYVTPPGKQCNINLC
jgi:hypothetical protein